MTIKVNELTGIKTEIADKFKALEIKDSEQLLEASKTPAQRKALADQIGLDPRELLRLANSADLSRINGVGGVFADLLEKAGVDTVIELALRRADNLHSKMATINARDAIVKQPPSESQVESWVEEAKSLPRGLEY